MTGLTLLSPWRLLLLVLPLALVVLTFVDARRKPGQRMRFSSLELFDGLAVAPSRWKQLAPVTQTICPAAQQRQFQLTKLFKFSHSAQHRRHRP